VIRRLYSTVFGLMLFSPGTPLALLAATDLETAKAIILAPGEKVDPLDQQIINCQAEILQKPTDWRPVERLGRLFISKARVSHDPGFYTLAEKCAVVLESQKDGEMEALLLRGHSFLALHKFREAESVARELLKLNDGMLEHALLGDALLEQGRLAEVIPVYQAMIDAKPCLPSYSRVAHLRWLKGDLDGAIEIIQEAITCGSYRDPEPMAWVTTRLALYLLQDGKSELALQVANRAETILPNAPPTLLARGRILLAQGRTQEAVEPLRQAARLNPLPEYLWLLADALQATGQTEAAAQIETELQRTGAQLDPRTFALYLATRRLQPEKALQFAAEELTQRADVHSHDALAWAFFALGNKEKATHHGELALREGTADARIFLHAGMILQASGKAEQASSLLQKARSLQQMLYPSEQAELTRSLAALATPHFQSGNPALVIQPKQ
jgi:tetratricopeptide (TPR) repeat protein